MKKYLSFLCSLFLLAGLLTGCDESPIGISTTVEQEIGDTTAATAAVADFSATDTEMFTERDLKTDYDDSECVRISLNGNSASATSDSVKISGSVVTVTADAPHIISGTLTDGMLIVDAPDTAKLQLIFSGVSIHRESSAALYIRSADKVFLTLDENSENSLSNGGSFTAIDENNIDGALFSKQDLTINGSGSLCVTSPAGHGIVCKDDLVITGGHYTVSCASHGLDANDSVRLTNASVSICAGQDGIHAENSDDASLGFVYAAGGNVTIEAEGDGISAAAYAQFQDGSFTLTAGGGSENGTKSASGNYGGFMGGGMGSPGGMRRPGQQETADTSTEEDSTSMKGIKAAGSMLFSGGTFLIDSADDALHADGSLTVNGGSFSLASGDDAVHAEDTLTVTACTMDISESYEGLEALHILISGGDIKLVASDDGLNAAGGTDQSGFTGGRDGMFGGGNMGGRPGGMGGMSSGANGSITISGGDLYINASGDGLDANGTLLISGGNTVVTGPTAGDTATLDYDTSGEITGGTFIGTGASGMAQTFSSSTQGVIALQVGNQTAGTNITVTDAHGNTLISYAPELNFQVVILSTPEMVSGETYTVSIGALSDQFQAN